MSVSPKPKGGKKVSEHYPIADQAQFIVQVERGGPKPDPAGEKRFCHPARTCLLLAEDLGSQGTDQALESAKASEPVLVEELRAAIQIVRGAPMPQPRECEPQPRVKIADLPSDESHPQGLNRQPGLGLETITCASESFNEGFKLWTPLGLNALSRAHKTNPRVFQRAGKLCRIKESVDHAEPPSLEDLTAHSLRGELDRSACWAEEIQTKKGPELRYGPPRLDIARDILSLEKFDPALFARIESVVEAPQFSPAGDLMISKGYHPEGRVYVSLPPELEGLSLPDRVTLEAAETARRFIFDNVFHDFPFDSLASKANALALMLLPFVRPMIPDATPNHHIGASTEGTGKGMLAAACCYPSLGREPDLFSQKENEPEWRKAITAFLKSGSSHWYCDNMFNPIAWNDDVPKPVDSGTLATFWTAKYWRDRLLGGNEEARIRIQNINLSTGNNTEFSRELDRRIARINLRAPCENPSLRTGWKHDPLLGWMKENRVELTRACLILCKFWIDEGMKPGKYIMGSFESYAKTMGGILDAIGVEGFLANRPKAAKSDPESNRWTALTDTWSKTRGIMITSTSDVMKMIVDCEGLMERFYEHLGDGTILSQKTRLGKALNTQRGRVWGEWRITKSSAKTADKSVLWRLKPKDEPEEAEEDEGRSAD